MKKKRLLLVTAGFPYGESERSFLLTEFQQLQKEFEVFILAVNTNLPLTHPMPEGVSVDRFVFAPLRGKKGIFSLFSLLHGEFLKELSCVWRESAPAQRKGRMLQSAAAFLNARQGQAKLRELVDRNGIDLVYTYWCREMAIGAALLKKQRPKLKLITRFHGIDLYEERNAQNWQPFRTLTGRMFDRLVFACDRARKYYLDRWGRQHQTKTVVSYLGCPPAEPLACTPAGPLQLVSCSNLIPLKRVDLMIDALALLPKTVEVCWHHIGDGPERDRLMTRAQEKLGEHISWKFCGALPNEEVFAHYRRISAQLFLTASATEGGVPVSLQECAAMGIPGIGTAVGGISEIIVDGKTGYLLPADATAEQIRDAIVRYCDLTEDERRQMQNHAWELWQERFDARVNACEFIQMVRELLAP